MNNIPKKVLFVGNRPAVLDVLVKDSRIELVMACVVKDSLIKLEGLSCPHKTLKGKKGKEELFRMINELDFDLLVSAGCPYILPISSFPSSKMYLNVHPTTLPQGRGRSPISEAILSGRNTFGVSVHYINDGIDDGKIILQESYKLTDDIDLDLLYSFLFSLEAEVFLRAMDELFNKDFSIEGQPQVGEMTYFNAEDFDLSLDVLKVNTEQFLRTVRAFSTKKFGINIVVEGAHLRVYSASLIYNDFLIQRFSHLKAGAIAIGNHSVLVIKLEDGLVRLDRWEKIQNAE